MDMQIAIQKAILTYYMFKWLENSVVDMQIAKPKDNINLVNIQVTRKFSSWYANSQWESNISLLNIQISRKYSSWYANSQSESSINLLNIQVSRKYSIGYANS